MLVHAAEGMPELMQDDYLEPEVREELLEDIPRAALALPVPENNLSGSGVPE